MYCQRPEDDQNGQHQETARPHVVRRVCGESRGQACFMLPPPGLAPRAGLRFYKAQGIRFCGSARNSPPPSWEGTWGFPRRLSFTERNGNHRVASPLTGPRAVLLSHGAVGLRGCGPLDAITATFFMFRKNMKSRGRHTSPKVIQQVCGPPF